ncbi:phage tail tape measure protein [Pseudomonas putida]|uniref:phage tail tape measure protein n=1 Tax=Pseudomonas putida TaxID=303 RepID=UPI0039064079
MASKLAISLLIGGAVASSVGAAFRTVESGIDKLKKKGDKAKVLQSTIGETIKLREEWKRAHDSGAASADKLLRKLNGNLDALRKQGVEVGRLGREYQRLTREAKAADLQIKGQQQIASGTSSLKANLGAAAVGVGLTAVPTKISADYQSIIRDIAIKADAANKPEEVQLSRSIIQTSNDTGMARNDVADLINQLVGAGMELDKAMAYSSTAAKFAVGQGASGVDTASMIMALQQNAKINDPKVMQQALEAIAYQGQAGSFEASDMAKWFPQLLAGMEKNGITGLDAVTSLGSMLQVQMKTAGSSDEAANNFKNWMEKIGAGDVVKAYKDAGIDYQASLNTGLQKGMNVIEASMGLAMQYVQATDPAKAQKMKDAQAKIDKEVDPEKAKAALEALEKTLRTGDLFADMQVKAALTAYGQNRGLYNELKAESTKATGILDKNLAERRETSSQRWSELLQSTDDAMRSIGDAIRPATDAFAQGATTVVQGITKLSDKFPEVVMGLGALAAAIGALLTARSAARIGRGVVNLARGRALGYRRGGRSEAVPAVDPLPKTGNPLVDAGLDALGKTFGAPASNDSGPVVGNDPQRVFVVNADAIGRYGGSNVGASTAEPVGSRRARRRRRRVAAKLSRPGTSVRVPRASVPTAPAPSNVPTPLPKPSVQLPAPGAQTLVGAASPELGRLGQIVRGVRNVTRHFGKLPGGKLADAIPGVLDTAINAETRDEKAEGYGGAAGGMAGAWAGASVGATIGSVVPVIGTAIGGAIGMAIGGIGGEALGGWLSKKLFGEDKPEAVAEASEQKGEHQTKAVAAERPPAPPPVAISPVVTAPAPVPVVLAPPAPATQVVQPASPLEPVPSKPVVVVPPPITAQPRATVSAGATPVSVVPAPVVLPAAPVAPVKPSVLPAVVTAPRERAPSSPAPGDVVRDIVVNAPPPSPAKATQAAAPVKAAPPKVEQSFTFAPNMSIEVHGDLKDPGQIVREAEPVLRGMWERFGREVSARMASAQLFDAPDVA